MGKKLIALIIGLGFYQTGLFIFIITIIVHVIGYYGLTSFIHIGKGTLEYETIARNVALGHGFVLKPGGETILWRPPFYIYLIACFHKYFEYPYNYVVVFQMVLNSLTCVLTYKIGKKIFNWPIGFLSALTLACYPFFTINSYRIMPESLFSFLLAIFMFFLVRGYQKLTWKHIIGFGILLGIATLTKASIQFFPILFGGILLLFGKDQGAIWQRLKNMVLLIGATFLIISPWTIRNYFVAKEFILLDTSGGYTFWIGNRIATDGYDDDPLPKEKYEEVKREIAHILSLPYKEGFNLSNTAWGSGANSFKLYREGIKNIIHNPGQTGLLWIKKLYRFWFQYIGGGSNYQVLIFALQGMLLVFSGVGIYFCIKNKIIILPLLSLIFYFLVIHMASTANARYSIPVIPYVIILGIYGMARLGIKKKVMLP